MTEKRSGVVVAGSIAEADIVKERPALLGLVFLIVGRHRSTSQLEIHARSAAATAAQRAQALPVVAMKLER